MVWGRTPPEAETLLLNKRAIFNAPLMKVVTFVYAHGDIIYICYERIIIFNQKILLPT